MDHADRPLGAIEVGDGLAFARLGEQLASKIRSGSPCQWPGLLSLEQLDQRMTLFRSMIEIHHR